MDSATEWPMKMTWPAITLALGTMTIFFAAVIILTNIGVDASEVMTTVVLLLVMVLGVLGWKNQEKMDTKIDQVKEAGNGRLSELIEENKRLQDQITALALRIPPRDAP